MTESVNEELLAKRWTVVATSSALFLVGAIMRVQIFILLWAWFVAVPFGLPALSSRSALGLLVVWLFLLPTCQKDETDLATRSVKSILTSLIWGTAGFIIERMQ